MNLFPQIKKLYALRDVTGTVDSMPLIASSIISKKIASGAQIIELDVKYGDGAFMKTKKDAKALAQLMIQVGKRLNKKIRAVISDMNEPLGYAIGNNLEVIESIETLKGRGPQDLKNLCLHICADFLVAAKRFKQYDEALQFATKQLESQAALEKFKEFVIAQGGDVRCVDDYSYFKQAKYTYSILSDQTGKIKKVKALQIGHAAMLLGGGRQSKEDIIDMSAGIVLKVKAKETIKKQEPLAVLYTDKPLTKEIETLVKSAFVFEK